MVSPISWLHCRLFLAVLVVDQHRFLVGQRRLHPGVGGAATEEGFDFGNGFHDSQTA